MKKFSFLGALAFALMVFASSCSDPCKDVTCVNGECAEGDCICDAGYEGADCSTAINAKWAGSYNLSETCSPTGAAGPYAVSVSSSATDPTKVTFTGLWEEAQATATATVTSANAFTIARQSYSTGGWEIEGDGTLNTSANTITINYTIYTGSASTATDDCTGTLTLQ